MTLTKKNIAEKVIVKRGSGFNPEFSYYVSINGDGFSRGFTDWNIYADNGQKVGYAENKKQFVDAVKEVLSA